MDEKTEQLIANIAENQAIPEDDVKEVWEAKLEEVEEAGMKGDEAQDRAQKLLFLAFKRKQQSNTVKIEGIILGAGDRYDAVNYSRKNAIDAYQENPQGAIREGEVAIACPPEEAGNLTGNGVEVVGEKNGWAIVTFSGNDGLLQYPFAERDSGQADDAETDVEEGWRLYPLDNRKKFNSGDENNHFGMPVDKHQWTRRGTGLFFTDDPSDIRISHLTFHDKQSAPNPPLGKPIQMKARVNEADDSDELYVHTTSDTEISPNPELEEKLTKSIDQIIEDNFRGTEFLHTLESLYEYMAGQPDNARRTIIVKSDVSTIDMEPNSNDTLRMVLAEHDWQGAELVEREATVWIPAWQEQYIDFAADSQIYVVGQAQMQDAYDPSTGGRSSDKKEVVINCQGLYADPTFKIPREDNVEEITDEDVDFSGGDSGSEDAFANGGEESDW